MPPGGERVRIQVIEGDLGRVKLRVIPELAADGASSRSKIDSAERAFYGHTTQTHQAPAAFSRITIWFRNSAAFVSPSSGDISESSCSIDRT